jgi:hypothetical protein
MTWGLHNDIFGSKSKDWTQYMQDAIPHRSLYVVKVHDLIGSFFCSSWSSEGETVTVAGVLFGSFTMVELQIREGNWTSTLSEFTCHRSQSSCWCQACCFLGIVILPWCKHWQKFILDPLHWLDSTGRLENVSICIWYDKILLLMEKFRVAFLW